VNRVPRTAGKVSHTSPITGSHARPASRPTFARAQSVNEVFHATRRWSTRNAASKWASTALGGMATGSRTPSRGAERQAWLDNNRPDYQPFPICCRIKKQIIAASRPNPSQSPRGRSPCRRPRPREISRRRRAGAPPDHEVVGESNPSPELSVSRSRGLGDWGCGGSITARGSVFSATYGHKRATAAVSPPSQRIGTHGALYFGSAILAKALDL